MSITFRCPQCSRQLTVAPQYAGRKGKCPGCGQVFMVPAPAKSSGSPSCPSCGATVSPDAVICVGCGFDRRTRTRIAPSVPAPSEEVETPSPAEPDGLAVSDEVETPSSAWPKRRTIVVVAAISVAVAVGAAFAIWMFIPPGELPDSVKELMALVNRSTLESRGREDYEVFLALLARHGDIYQAVGRVSGGRDKAAAISELARVVAEKHDSPTGSPGWLVYDQAVWALYCFSDTDADAAAVRKTLQKRCEPPVAQKVIAELDALRRK